MWKTTSCSSAEGTNRRAAVGTNLDKSQISIEFEIICEPAIKLYTCHLWRNNCRNKRFNCLIGNVWKTTIKINSTFRWSHGDFFPPKLLRGVWTLAVRTLHTHCHSVVYSKWFFSFPYLWMCCFVFAALFPLFLCFIVRPVEHPFRIVCKRHTHKKPMDGVYAHVQFSCHKKMSFGKGNNKS